MKTRCLTLLACIILLLSGCSQLPMTNDSDLFANDPCSPPCWNGISPGFTSFEDTELLVKELVENGWKERIQDLDDCKWVMLESPSFLGVSKDVDIYIKNDRVTFIGIRAASFITIGKIVDYYDEPEYFEALHAKGPDGEGYSIKVFYPSKGMAFQLLPNLQNMGRIKPSIRIGIIQYYQSGNLIDYFVSRYSCGMGEEEVIENAQVQIKHIQKWKGFGSIEVIETR